MSTETDREAHSDLLHSAIETLSAEVVVFDADGSVVTATEASAGRTGCTRSGGAPDGSGIEYVEALDGIEDAYATRAAEGLAALFDGERDQFELEYPHQSTDDQRWALLRATAFAHRGERYVAVGNADITDRKERERTLAYQTALLEAQAETTIDGLLVVDSDRTVRYHNDRFLDVWGIPEEAAETESDEVLLDAVHDRLANPDRFYETIERLYDHPHEQSRDAIELTDGRWIDRYSAPVVGDDGTHYGRLWTFRDATEQKERERTLERQRDELAQLQRVNTLVRRSLQALQNTTTRAEVETAVCEALTESALYQAAWIADWAETAGGDRIVRPRTVAGVDESYLEDLPESGPSPAAAALRTGDVQAVTDIATAPEFPDERREIALDHGHHALAAIPVAMAGTTYGVLVVYAPPDHAIGETERDILADLGRSIALAIQRVHSQRSLTAETAISISLRVPDAEFVLGRVSAESGAEFALERRVATGDETAIYYLSVSGADVARARELLRQDPHVSTCAVVRNGDGDAALVEVHVTAEPGVPVGVLTDFGATVISARAADGDIALRVELPPGTDVRAVLSAVRSVDPDVELTNKQHVDRPTETAAAMQDQVTAQLTDRQEAVLEAAYARGYYAWSRETTMEEIAETFDVSAPTLHYHLRKAHETVIGALLDPQQVYDEQSEPDG